MNGVLVINKEKGFTSRDVVNKVSNILGTKKVGHTGTLDPMATGVLVLCVGSSLKLVELLQNHDKEYVALVKLGIMTDTLDITGNVVKSVNFDNVTKEKIDEVLKSFKGKIRQEVPKYSAVKVNGRKLYEYARSGEEVELPVHEVFVYDIKRVSDFVDGTFKIRCSVSKGTYIRSLVRDIGYALGTVATMCELERTRLGIFDIKNTYRVDDLLKGNYLLYSPREVLNIPCVVVDERLAFKVRNGCVMDSFFDCNMVFVEDNNHNLLAIYKQIGNNKVKPYRMFVS